ncbi:hypothetical protein F511_34384 [Dorcoceras hygrometricum]|uniref:Uncharacterized protein n=1 Tax=Dorcoceras hygrometricum TaxID=472368 RepID=A0A2Z7AZ85_9LAMI|nr:hypothetical protein F511_34384 [Dorcoceras hygrometricum]
MHRHFPPHAYRARLSLTSRAHIAGRAARTSRRALCALAATCAPTSCTGVRAPATFHCVNVAARAARTSRWALCVLTATRARTSRMGVRAPATFHCSHVTSAACACRMHIAACSTRTCHACPTRTSLQELRAHLDGRCARWPQPMRSRRARVCTHPPPILHALAVQRAAPSARTWMRTACSTCAVAGLRYSGGI